MNQLISILIGGGLVLLGIIISYVLSKRQSYNTSKPDFLEDKVPEKSEGVKHYEETRDKIVEKAYKKKKIEVEVEYSGFNLVGAICRIIAFIVVIFVFSNIMGAVCPIVNEMNTTEPIDASLICNENGRAGALMWIPIILGAIIMFTSLFKFWGDEDDYG